MNIYKRIYEVLINEVQREIGDSGPPGSWPYMHPSPTVIAQRKHVVMQHSLPFGQAEGLEKALADGRRRGRIPLQKLKQKQTKQVPKFLRRKNK